MGFIPTSQEASQQTAGGNAMAAAARGAARRQAAACPHCGKAMRLPLGALPQVAGCLGCSNAVLFREVDVPAEPAPGVPDIRTESEAGGLIQRLLAAAPERLEALPAMPGVFQQVLALIHDPISEMDDIVQAVERDSTLTLHLMKVANSAVFRGTKQIADPRSACVRLGMKEVANVVWRIQCAGAFRAPRADLTDMMTELWSKSVAAGFCTRSVARASQAPDAEMAFLAGLTHAVGQTLLVQLLLAERDFAVQRLMDPGDPHFKVMYRLGPIMSLLVLQHWGLPPAVRSSALYQRAPHLAPTEATCRLSHGLVLGIELARLQGYGMEDNYSEQKVRMSCLALGFAPGHLQDMAESIQADLADFVGAMALE